MKTTLDIADELLLRAKRQARRSGRPLRALVEEGLRLALDQARRSPEPFMLSDRSVGDPNGENPLELLSWQELRGEIYGDH